MQIEPPTLVGILDRMERNEWIERQACPDDRRKKPIHPTETALPVWSKILACAKEVRSRATHGLSARQQASLKRLLEIVQQNLSAEAAAQEKVS